MSEKEVTTDVMTTGNFTLQAQMPMGKTITVSGYIYSDSTPDSINKQINLLHDAIDYQRTRSEIPELQAKLDQRVIALGQMRDAMTALVSKQDAGAKLTSQEKKAISDMRINVTRVQEDIEKGEAAILDSKKKVGLV